MKLSKEVLVTTLRLSFSQLTANSIFNNALSRACVDLDNLEPEDARTLLKELGLGINLYLRTAAEQQECMNNLRGLFEESDVPIRTSLAPNRTFSQLPSVDNALSSAQAVVEKLSSLVPPDEPDSDSIPGSTAMVSLDETQVLRVLREYLGDIIANTVWKNRVARAGVDLAKMLPADKTTLLKELENGSRLYINNIRDQRSCRKKLEAVLACDSQEPEEIEPIVICVTSEMDIVSARSAGLELCQKAGFHKTEQIKIATIVSELTRNIVQYAGFGHITIRVVEDGRTGIEIKASDEGPGISNLDEIMSGDYVSKKGMGKGLLGTKKLMDLFEIETGVGRGTTIITKKYLEQ